MDFACKHCNKKYKTIQSRSNHYRIYHNSNVKVCKGNVKVDDAINDNSEYSCNYCNKIFKVSQEAKRRNW